MNCPKCRKSVREDAARCHRCGRKLIDEPDENDGSPEYSVGGYDEKADGFEYDEYLHDEFGERPQINKLWYYTAWVLLLILLAPVFFYFVRL